MADESVQSEIHIAVTTGGVEQAATNLDHLAGAADKAAASAAKIESAASAAGDATVVSFERSQKAVESLDRQLNQAVRSWDQNVRVIQSFEKVLGSDSTRGLVERANALGYGQDDRTILIQNAVTQQQEKYNKAVADTNAILLEYKRSSGDVVAVLNNYQEKQRAAAEYAESFAGKIAAANKAMQDMEAAALAAIKPVGDLMAKMNESGRLNDPARSVAERMSASQPVMLDYTKPVADMTAAMSAFNDQSRSMIGRLGEWSAAARQMAMDAAAAAKPLDDLAVKMTAAGSQAAWENSIPGRMSSAPKLTIGSETPVGDMMKKMTAAGDQATFDQSMVGRMSSYAQATGAAGKATDDFAEATARMKKGLFPYEIVNFTRQIEDVGVSLYSGQQAMTVFVQQGAQMYDILNAHQGGFKDGVKALGESLLGLITPAATAAVGVTAAFATMGYSIYAQAAAVRDLQSALNGIGRTSGLTLQQTLDASTRAAGAGDISISAAREAAGQYLRSGVSGSSIEGAIGLGRSFGNRMGMSETDATKTLASALADPASGAKTLADNFDLLTRSQVKEIEAIAGLGDRSAATAKLLDMVRTSMEGLKDPSTNFGNWLHDIGVSMSNGLTNFGAGIMRGADRGFNLLSGQGYHTTDYLNGGDAAAQQKAQAAAAQKAADELAARMEPVNKIADDARLAAESIMAQSFAEKAAIIAEKERIDTLRDGAHALEASATAEGERAKLLADSARQARDYALTGSRQLEMAGMNPYDRAKAQIMNEYNDLTKKIVPPEAEPLKASFDVAATAATTVATAFNDLAAVVAGVGIRAAAHMNDNAGKNTLPAFAGGSFNPNDDLFSKIIKAEGTGKFGDPYNTSLGYMKSPKPLTSMTMDESLAWGDKVRKAQGMNSSAKGAFQIVNSTQRDAMKALGLGGNEMFSPENQQAMAAWIAKTQGIGAWEGFKRPGADLPTGKIIDVARSDSAAATADKIRSDAEKGKKDRLDALNAEFYDSKIKEMNKDIDLQTKALDAQVAAFGKSDLEVAQSAKNQEILNGFQKQGVKLTEDQKKEVEDLAGKYAQLAVSQKDAAKAQADYNKGLDQVRGVTSSSLADLATGLVQGNKPKDVLKGILGNVESTGFSNVANYLTTKAFGDQGTPGSDTMGGKLFGKADSLGKSLFDGIADMFGFGSGKAANAQQMNVNATTVNVSGATASPGGLGGGGTGSGGLLQSLGNAIGSFFNSGPTPTVGGAGSLAVPTFAEGGVMGPSGPIPMRAYAGGGVAHTPQLALFGEGSGPEAFVPLKGGAIPVQMNGNGGGTSVSVHNYAGVDVEPRVTAGHVELIVGKRVAQAMAQVPTMMQDYQRRTA